MEVCIICCAGVYLVPVVGVVRRRRCRTKAEDGLAWMLLWHDYAW